MTDRLRVLTTVLQISVNKHGENTPLTLGHLLNICRLAQKFEAKIVASEEEEHRMLMEQINPFGQD